MEKDTAIKTSRNTTVVLKCTCEHEYQDERYGNRMRLHNRTGKDASSKSWRCTVCGSVKKQ